MKFTLKSLSKRKKVLIIVCSVIFVVVAVVYAVFFHYYSMLDYKPLEDEPTLDYVENETDPDLNNSSQSEIDDMVNSINNNINSVTELSSKYVQNFLLIGTDSRSNDGRGRSDAMILVSVNSKSKKVVLTSFLRDIYLYIPSVGNNRLNASYAYGGTSLLLKTLRQNFGITCDKYASVNFFSFIDVIDALGGVDIDVTSAEIPYINHNLKEINKLRGLPSGTYSLSSSQAGSIHLNGSQALAYARIRYIGTDFGRTDRQRKVITSLMTSFKSASIGEINSFASKVLPLVSTNLTQGDLIKLISSIGTYRNYEIKSQSIPANGTYKFVTINKMAVISIDFKKNIQILKESIYQ